MIQTPAQSNDFVIGQLQRLLYQPPRLADKSGGVIDLGLGDTFPGVGPERDLIDIVADG